MSQTPNARANLTVFEQLTNLELVSRDDKTNIFVYNGAEVVSHYGGRGIYGNSFLNNAHLP